MTKIALMMIAQIVSAHPGITAAEIQPLYARRSYPRIRAALLRAQAAGLVMPITKDGRTRYYPTD